MGDEQLSLESIGILEATDKSVIYQDYLRHYERIFAGLRDKPITMIEIGVWRGSSLRMWSRFFPRATVVGVDIDPRCKLHAGGRIVVEIGSQDDPEFLTSLVAKYPPDIIIDDGSHRAEHVLFTFDRLFSSVRPGGYYVMEDLYLHYRRDAPHYRGNVTVTPSELLANMAVKLNADQIDVADSSIMQRYLFAQIDRVEFIRKAAIVQKTRTDDFSTILEQTWPLLEQSDDPENWFAVSMFIMRNNGDLDRAVSAMRRALAINPTNAAYHHRLCDCLSRKGDIDGALEAAKSALELAPGNATFTALMAGLEARRQK